MISNCLKSEEFYDWSVEHWSQFTNLAIRIFVILHSFLKFLKIDFLRPIYGDLITFPLPITIFCFVDPINYSFFTSSKIADNDNCLYTDIWIHCFEYKLFPFRSLKAFSHVRKNVKQALYDIYRRDFELFGYNAEQYFLWPPHWENLKK